MTKVILISGKARSGKDTLGNMLKDQIEHTSDNNVCIFHIADYLKYFVATYRDWDGKKDEVGRTLLQDTGTVGRQIYEDFWVEVSRYAIMLLSKYYDYVIIPDVRYKNELTRLSEFFNTYSIRINRKQQNDLSEAQQNHKSEVDLDDYEAFDKFINNDYTLDILREEAKNIVNII